MDKGHFICHSCGKEEKVNIEKPPCETLKGWIMATNWKDYEAVDQFAFCSFSCLKRWVDSNVTKIPDVFIRSFEEKDNEKK